MSDEPNGQPGRRRRRRGRRGRRRGGRRARGTSSENGTTVADDAARDGDGTGATPPANERATPAANRGASPQANRGTSPPSTRGASPQANRGASPPSTRGASPPSKRGAARASSRHTTADGETSGGAAHPPGGASAPGDPSASGKRSRPARSARARLETSAGGIVVREHRGETLFLLIRDSYRNWGFPKGHLESGEGPADAALREVAEETGLVGLELAGQIETIDWTFRFRGKLVHKTCHFYLMRTDTSRTVPQREEGITACRWAPYDEARRLVSYENARAVLQRANAMLTGSDADQPTGAAPDDRADAVARADGGHEAPTLADGADTDADAAGGA